MVFRIGYLHEQTICESKLSLKPCNNHHLEKQIPYTGGESELLQYKVNTGICEERRVRVRSNQN